jgi:foldase protein PrsA
MVTIGRRTRALAHAIRRMPRRPRSLVALGAALVATLAAAAILAGGSGGVPRDAVATVDGEAIDKGSFEHWLAVAASSGGKPAAQVPRPPDYTACIAAKRKAEPKPKPGQNKTPEAKLEAECETEYRSLRDRALQLLITQRWIEGEAEELGISVKDAEVKEAFERQRKQSFPKDADYRKFLASSGQTEQDILMRVRVDLLSSKVRDRIAKGDDEVTEAQIARHYRLNKARFAEPARRDVRLVLTDSRAKAERAKAALQSGRSWRAVAKEFSIDRASRLQGGRLAGVAEGDQEPGLDDALFEARKGRLTGPVQTQFGQYIFDVVKISRGSQQTLEQATPAIRQLLVAERRQQRIEAFGEKFREKWQARTECREGYEMQDCKNAPKATPTPTPGRGSNRSSG